MKKNTRNLLLVVLALLFVLSAVVLVACKKNEKYTVTFDSNGGTEVQSITDVEKNSAINEPAAPTRDGHVFKGWYSDTKLTKAWNFDTDKVKGNMTLYAKWEFIPTNDLQMLLNDTSYTVVGIGKATGIADLVIPSVYNNLPVKTIAVNAFANVKSITSVFIPSSVTAVKDCAFLNCENLKTATIAGKAELGERVFEDCSNLERVTLPDGLTEIKTKTFKLCASLVDVNVPSSVTSIGEQAFYGCKSLSSVGFPSALTAIENEAFSSCEHITEVKLPSTLKSLGVNVFSGCIRIETLTVESNNSATYYSEGNCIISRTAGNDGKFVYTVVAGCQNSRIPSNVTIIGEGAFYGCKKLNNTNVIPSGITTIGDHAFASCVGLERLAIPSTVTSIGEGAFTGCENLQSVTFTPSPDESKLETVGREAFSHCLNLVGFIIPKSVTFIGVGAFYDITEETFVLSYRGTGDEFRSITIGSVEEGEENIYNGSITVSCVGSEITVPGLVGQN